MEEFWICFHHCPNVRWHTKQDKQKRQQSGSYGISSSNGNKAVLMVLTRRAKNQYTLKEFATIPGALTELKVLFSLQM
ncbi:hypothetical protein ISN44_Un238g000010 [Arabidopsis suecica]|uniref:Uncharacterized protein n=1 Tax=Arabidopsis suecica TaxID=45249 RepID=A0A8T1XGN8_ARASU|nr:hypothetical protein ISN44_Un238g000010 [Arabidopsis suecica]